MIEASFAFVLACFSMKLLDKDSKKMSTPPPRWLRKYFLKIHTKKDEDIPLNGHVCLNKIESQQPSFKYQPEDDGVIVSKSRAKMKSRSKNTRKNRTQKSNDKIGRHQSTFKYQLGGNGVIIKSKKGLAKITSRSKNTRKCPTRKDEDISLNKYVCFDKTEKDVIKIKSHSRAARRRYKSENYTMLSGSLNYLKAFKKTQTTIINNQEELLKMVLITTQKQDRNATNKMTMMQKQEDEDDIAMQWYQLAQLVDRISFWLFSLMFIASLLMLYVTYKKYN